jgi:hypothetical protein
MKLDLTKIEAAFSLAQKTLENQDLPDFMKHRWLNALKKAKERLIEQPYFAWQSDRLTIVSLPQKKKDVTGCHFYQANDETCHRVDKLGFCQAFYEGFPCWHRAAFLLLGIYFGDSREIRFEKAQEKSVSVKSVNQS